MSTLAAPPRIQLRAGDMADLDEVMVTMVAAFDPGYGEAWTRAQCAGILALPGVWLDLARIDGCAAGFALSRVVADEAELLLLAVQPSLRRQGVAGALLGAVGQGARMRGGRRLHLEVRANNPAMALYRAAGFEQVGRRPGYYRGREGQLFDALTLARPIAN